MFNLVVSSDVPPFAPTTDTISPARSIPQTPPSKSEIVSAIKSIPTWDLIEMRNNLKKDIEAIPICRRSALESEYKTKKKQRS